MTDQFLDLGGTIRAMSPEQSLARLRPLLPSFGITRVMAQEGLADFKIPVSVSCRPNSRLLSTSQGKGITRDLADISAIMESIEMFHAERLPPAAVVASTAELRQSGRRFLEPESLAVIPTRQSLFLEHEPLGWLELERLADGERVLVPRFHFDLDRSNIAGKEASLHAFDVSSNGLASGNTTQEAIVHGLYELIERYCVCEYFKLDLEQRRAHNLDLTTVEVPAVQAVMQLVERTGFGLGVRAIPSPFGVAVFRARLSGQAAGQAGDRSPLSDGYGAHHLPEIALLRAITEAIQVRVTYITGSRDDMFPQAYKHLDPETLKVFPPSSPVLPTPVRWADVPRAPSFASFAEVIRWTVEVLERNGFPDACYFNHERAEYGGIPVVTVVCPKLRYDRKVFHAVEQE
ncbi:MAG TPA: YcaO-like family protein [Kofleriaceae bacterium]